MLVSGAGGMLGELLADHCERLGMSVLRAGRQSRSAGWIAWNMEISPPPDGVQPNRVLHAAPLWLLPEQLAELASRGLGGVVCFGSTSAVTKCHSTNRHDRRLAEVLSRAEQRIHAEASRLRITATILRPTMIYGYGRDRNISAIAGFIRRYRFFPLAGAASGRRQPVHVDDLVDSAIAVLDCDAAHGNTYELAGRDTLSYRAMVARVFEALGMPQRILSLPVGLYRSMLGIAGRFHRDVNGALVERMSQDMVFECSQARADFGFAPQGFLERPERDLPAP